MRRLPSNDMTFDIARTVADEIRAAVGRGAAGVVVTQGTDTIEELAYAWDLLVAGDAPTVVTGAMRHAALASADGAGNLLDAVRTAASPQARGLGCLVVFNEEIHAARAVRKTHTSSLAAFRSAGVGPLGLDRRGRAAAARAALPADHGGAAPGRPGGAAAGGTIAMDDDGWWLPAVAQAPGLVVAGTGGGHVPGWLSDQVVELAGRIPVVLASRTGDGEVLTDTYGGFGGSESVLVQGGLIPAGTLDPYKARVLLGTAAQRGRRPRTDPHDHRRGGHPLPQAARRTSEADVTTAGARPGDPRRHLVTDSWSGAATVTVAGGRITGCSTRRPRVDGAEVLDATGLLVMPGGVDPHCHVAVPLGEFVTLDSFESASLAALAGGTTTIIDFAIPATGEGSIAALEAKLAMAKDSRCDYAFHGCINAPGPDIADVVRRYVEEGVRTVKLFTTYRGLLMVEIDTIEKVMRALNEVSGLTYVHAESNQLVEAAQAEAESAGRIGAAGMARTRPEAAEARAVQEVLGAAERTGAPVYFVHQTIPAAVDEVIAARQRGVRAFSESCPHYLVLDDSCYAGEHPERYVCCPPHPQPRRRGRPGRPAGQGLRAHRRQRPLLLRHRAEGAARARRAGDAQRPARGGDPAVRWSGTPTWRAGGSRRSGSSR